MILIGFAVLPAALLMLYIYKKDRLDSESPRILGKCLLGGLLAAVASIVLESILAIPISSLFEESTVLYAAVENFIGVALVEEGTKLFFCKLFTWRDREFDYRFDGLVYMVFVSLSFAAIENVLYLFIYGPGVLLTRALISIPGHAGFAVLSGTYYGTAKMYDVHGQPDKARSLILTGLLFAVLAHGFFDFCLTIESDASVIIFVVFIVALDILVLRRVKLDSANDQLITYV